MEGHPYGVVSWLKCSSLVANIVVPQWLEAYAGLLAPLAVRRPAGIEIGC